MAKGKTINKLFVLERALFDQSLTQADALTLAVLIEYRNSASGKAWPSVPSLAHVTGRSQRCVQLSLRRLESGGYISTRLGGGRNSSIYEVLLNDDKSPLVDRIKGAAQRAHERRTVVHPSRPREVNNGSREVNNHSSRGERPFTQTLLKNPSEINPSADSAGHSSECQHVIETISQPEHSKRKKRKPETPLPEGFPDQEAKLEAKNIFTNAGARLEAEAEAEKFRDYHLAKDSRFRDWRAAFRMWARNAVKYASRDAPTDKRENPYKWAM